MGLGQGYGASRDYFSQPNKVNFLEENGKSLNMKSLVLIITLIVSLAACSSMAKRKEAFEVANQAWVGRKADDLVISKGPPMSTYTLSTGGKVFEYSKQRTISGGGNTITTTRPVLIPNSSGGTWVNVPHSQTMPAYTQTLGCKIIYQISQSDEVTGWTAEGNDCY